ncbi:MAG: hypothetical protein HQL32_10465 [Planctomycetes bacterium]|nr:hypothetical protein [Planctomycetota bacterium]
MPDKYCIIIASEMEARSFIQRFPSGPIFKNGTISFYEGDEYDLLICGIGLINCSYALGLIADRSHKYYLNLGIAGGLSNELKIGEIIEVGQCHSAHIKHPFLHHLNAFKWGPGKTITSAGMAIHDKKAKEELGQNAELVDMEAFAIATCAYYAKTPLLMLKAISDNADKEDTKDIIKRIPELMNSLWERYAKLNMEPGIVSAVKV